MFKYLYECKSCDIKSLEDFEMLTCSKCDSDKIYFLGKYEEKEEEDHSSVVDVDEIVDSMLDNIKNKRGEIEGSNKRSDLLRSELRVLEADLKDFRSKHFIVIDSYVILLEDIVTKKMFKKDIIPKGTMGVVSRIGEGNVEFIEGKTNDKHIVSIDHLKKIEWEEYKLYMFEEVFTKAGRKYLEYREGDIVTSDYTGTICICQKLGYNNELVFSESVKKTKDSGSYFKMYSPLVFVENIKVE